MARSTRSSQLESRSARLKLPKRGKPHWIRIDRGLSLGYRRIETAGPWIVRKATGDALHRAALLDLGGPVGEKVVTLRGAKG